jgi:hypothetical protein
MADPPAQKELLEAILIKFDDAFVKMTLPDAYNAMAGPKHGWNEFVKAINHLKSEGLLEGKGDGFAVCYSLTKKGRAAVKGRS